MIKIGDKVRFLSSVGGGVVTRISGNMAYVMDDDGFETPSLIKELVAIGQATIPSFSKEVKQEQPIPQPTAAMSIMPEPEYIPEETPGGDVMNVVLAYIPVDILKLSTTTFETYLVNDSNYYLYFTYATRDDDGKTWTARHHDLIEPNTQLFIGELVRDEINKIGHVTIQIIAFKKDKEFDIKPAVSVELRVDVTKFFKLHCFTDNIYFDERALSFDIIKDDKPFHAKDSTREQVKNAVAEKRAADREIRRPVKKTATKKGEPIVVDLHIQELVDSTTGLSNAEMLNMQVDRFRQIMDSNLKNHGQKIIFIHGKGEGVLRKALLKELNYRYKGHDVQDASFREYGFGATQVTIR